MKIFHLRKAFWVYTLLIFIMAILPINGTKSFLNNSYILSIRLDYLAHFAIFIPWMFLAWLSYGLNFRINFRYGLLWFLVGLSIAWLSEGIQYIIPYRAFNVNDLLANTIGVLLGTVFFWFPLPRFVVKS